MTVSEKPKRALTALHTAALLFGLAGLFGKIIHASPLVIAAGRTFFAAIALALVLIGTNRQGIRTFRAKDLWLFILPGILLALHWWTFFHGIQISTVAAGLLGFASFPMFITLFEPYLFKEPFRLFDLAVAMLIMAGLVVVAWPDDLNNARCAGVLWGIVSGGLFAALSMFNRRIVRRFNAITIACFQNTAACLVMLPVAFFLESWRLSLSDLLLLVILGVVCTALAHTLFIFSLTVVRAQLAGIVTALEPVYGICFAFLLLGEKPSIVVLLGGALIIGTTCAAILGAWRL
ncbi:MAG: DMT family transporter [Desulfobacteraceae bacterium]|nr:DMT family transporter [Desulfobacteraceae bacterium]